MKEYEDIKEYYGDNIAKRSQVPLVNHIDEGLDILKHIRSSENAQRAFCLHPLFQNDEAYQNYVVKFNKTYDQDIEILVREYVKFANWYLCKPETDDWNLNNMPFSKNDMSRDCRDMLVADKIQNYKDFMKYHYGSHQRSEELKKYFITWFKILE